MASTTEANGTSSTTNPTAPNITILGAGVIGLTTALELSRSPSSPSITIIASHMPGDYDINYASPWAGADFLPLGAADTLEAGLERATWPVFSHLATEVPEAGIHFQPAHLYARTRDDDAAKGDGKVSKFYASRSSATPWFADLMPDFRTLEKGSGELPEGYDRGTAFTSVVVNTPLYLGWLLGQCVRNGVVVRRGVVTHVVEAAGLHSVGRADVVVNCTGLGARTLGGVEDLSVVPARGQIVVVRNDPGVLASTGGTDDASDESCYIMHRAAGGGAVLGGCYQKGSWDAEPDLELAKRIMTRAVTLVPALTGGGGIEKLSVIRHAVGLRPVREGGTRIERETVDDCEVVHCYGHGGYGYQSSWGSAQQAAKLVHEALGTVRD